LDDGSPLEERGLGKEKNAPVQELPDWFEKKIKELAKPKGFPPRVA